MPNALDTIAPTRSDRLRAGTASAHSSAERSGFLTRLLGGELDIAAWARLLEQLEFVYRALESTAETLRPRDALRPLLDPSLERTPAIVADLEHLRLRTRLEPVGMLPSTREYAERILATKLRPACFVAHHYTRYLGDLSGGQAIRVWLDRHYGLHDDERAFFRFDGIPSAPRFKADYRRALDALDLDEADDAALVDEARAAFAANEAVFTEVGEIVDAERARAVA